MAAVFKLSVYLTRCCVFLLSVSFVDGHHGRLSSHTQLGGPVVNYFLQPYHHQLARGRAKFRLAVEQGFS